MSAIALGADHAGFPLKEDLKAWLIERGHEVVDCGTQSSESVDYPDYAAAVAGAVTTGKAERGVLVCGTGIGMAIAANKRSEEHTSELQSQSNLVCRLLLEKKKKKKV